MCVAPSTVRIEHETGELQQTVHSLDCHGGILLVGMVEEKMRTNVVVVVVVVVSAEVP